MRWKTNIKKFMNYVRTLATLTLVGCQSWEVQNENSKELIYVKSTDIGIGLGTIGVGASGRTLKAALPLDGYFSVDSTIIAHNEDMTKFRKEIEKNIEYNLDEISKLEKDPETAIKNSYKLNKISKKLIDDVNRLRKW